MPNMKLPLNQGLSGEVKLKWLTQSHDAPEGTVRCRNCAMAGFRFRSRHFCPLKLASELDGERAEAISVMVEGFANSWFGTYLEPTAQDVLKQYQSGPLDDIEFRLGCFFSYDGHDLLQQLRKLQRDWDQRGILHEDPDDELPLAMTVRDCTLFLRIPKNDWEPIVARLGDLDIKSITKIPEWRRKEKLLVEGGWYTDEAGSEENCLLRPYRPDHRGLRSAKT